MLCMPVNSIWNVWTINYIQPFSEISYITLFNFWKKSFAIPKRFRSHLFQHLLKILPRYLNLCTHFRLIAAIRGSDLELFLLMTNKQFLFLQMFLPPFYLQSFSFIFQLLFCLGISVAFCLSVFPIPSQILIRILRKYQFEQLYQ